MSNSGVTGIQLVLPFTLGLKVSGFMYYVQVPYGFYPGGL